MIKDKHRKEYGAYESLSVTVNSIDGFQGGEKDLIVRSALMPISAGVGLRYNHRQINVSLKRTGCLVFCLFVIFLEYRKSHNMGTNSLVRKNRGYFSQGKG